MSSQLSQLGECSARTLKDSAPSSRGGGTRAAPGTGGDPGTCAGWGIGAGEGTWEEGLN